MSGELIIQLTDQQYRDVIDSAQFAGGEKVRLLADKEFARLRTEVERLEVEGKQEYRWRVEQWHRAETAEALLREAYERLLGDETHDWTCITRNHGWQYNIEHHIECDCGLAQLKAKIDAALAAGGGEGE